MASAEQITLLEKRIAQLESPSVKNLYGQKWNI